MSMAGITSTSRRHGDGRAYDHCGNRESPFLKPQNFANTIGKPITANHLGYLARMLSLHRSKRS
jgi:hypothetical protein